MQLKTARGNAGALSKGSGCKGILIETRRTGQKLSLHYNFYIDTQEQLNFSGNIWNWVKLVKKSPLCLIPSPLQVTLRLANNLQ